jgi:hypothetical protein
VVLAEVRAVDGPGYVGDLTLRGAQHEIATDWRAVYKKWINGKGCGEQTTCA